MQRFISCDWGTTSLRVRLIDPTDLSVVGQSTSKHGIGMVHNLWKQSGGSENDRPQFYKRFLADKILAIENETGIALSDVPVIISGMATSSIGMMEFPCVDLPVKADGSKLKTNRISPSNDFPYELILISGIKTGEDIARGEETQLAGCEHALNDEVTYVFPGTHSKHILVNDGTATDLKTYMTGEFLQLLSEKSILSYSVEQHDDTDIKSFEAGVKASQHENLMYTSFKVRTNDLFGKFSKLQNFNFLKGLLIGTELCGLCGKNEIQIVANQNMGRDYSFAARTLNIKNLIQDAEKATITGHSKIFSNILK